MILTIFKISRSGILPFHSRMVQFEGEDFVSESCLFREFQILKLQSNRGAKTSQDLQHLILFFHSLQAPLQHIVPLIIQQRSPARNSQAGHCFLISTGHFFIFQHALRFHFFLEIRKNIWRSAWAAIGRHPCS